MSPSTKAKQLFEQLTRASKHGTSETGNSTAEPRLLDEHTRALVVIGAAVCSDSPTRTFKDLVTSARKAGATDEEILGVLFAVAPAAGGSRVVSVAPRLSKAIGYDVVHALEHE